MMTTITTADAIIKLPTKDHLELSQETFDDIRGKIDTLGQFASVNRSYRWYYITLRDRSPGMREFLKRFLTSNFIERYAENGVRVVIVGDSGC